MPKKYFYLVVLTQQNTQFSNFMRKVVTLDHPMASWDLTAIDRESSGKGLLADEWVSTNYFLQNVTGTFTYRFLFTYRLPNGASILRAFNLDFDHQITTNTISADYEYFRRKLLSENPGSDFLSDLIVLMHQEIPSE